MNAYLNWMAAYLSTFDSQWQILIYTILYFATSSAIIVPALFITRWIRNRLSRRKKALISKYQELITDYIYDETTELSFQPLLNTPLKRRFLLETLLKYRSNISGESSEKFRELYFKLGLDRIAVRLCKSQKWHRQVFGLKIIGTFADTNNRDWVSKGLTSKHFEVRVQSELSLVLLNPGNPLAFLENFNYPISNWGQINLLSIMDHTPDIVIPDFSRWYHHPIPSITIFALRMTAIYKQDQNIGKMLELIPSAPDAVKEEIFLALSKFEDPAILKMAESRFEEEPTTNKIALLKIFSNYPLPETLTYLKHLMLKESNPHILFHIAEALAAFGWHGKSIVAEYAINCEIPTLKSGITYLLKNK